MFILDGKPLSPDRAFTHNGIQYPRNWIRLASPEERVAIGITEQPDPPTWDQRFALGYDEQGELIWKDHAELVAQWTGTTRTTANTLLQPTDWLVIREADNGSPADPAVKQWREDIRLACGKKILAIEATVDTAELAAYLTGADYPAWPSQDPAPAPADPVV
jgi:hypothetical protein